MSNITAQMVAKLREITGLGMMECKKALVEAGADLKKAEELIRVRSGAKANKVADRTAAEGIITSFVSADAHLGSLVEINCETDFVAKDDSLISFANTIAKVVADSGKTTVAEISEVKLATGKTVEETRKDIIAKLGENISIRRASLVKTDGLAITYLHGKKIGVIVDLENGTPELGKDIAMHIAASKPICVDATGVDPEKIASERNIYSQQAAASGKPAEIVAKMVEGRIAKFLAEVTLVGQSFIKNPDQTIEKLLAAHKAKVNSFTMFVVGEGIEKKTVDFAAEVAAATKV